jgi:hypothetical protein
MKTNKIQNNQEAGAAQTARIEASSPQADDSRAYAPAGAAMASSASAPVESQPTESMKPRPKSGAFVDAEDMEMNRRLYGSSSTESQHDYEEEMDSDEEEEEYLEEDERGLEEASESGQAEKNGELEVSVKEIVRNINRIARGTVERGKMEIGEYVLQVVFKDKIDEVLSKSPYKTESLRQICDDPELRVDRRRLGNWVRAAALYRDLETNSVDCSAMMTSQLVALLTVKDQNKRRELASEVNNKGLSVRKILERADELNRNGNSLNAAKALRRKFNDPLSLLSDKEAVALLEDQDRLAKEIAYKDRIEMVTVIDEVADRIEVSKDFLGKVRDNLVLIDMQRLQRPGA